MTETPGCRAEMATPKPSEAWRRFWARWATPAALAVALVGLARIAILVPSRAVEDDFSHYYLAGELLLAGRNPYTVDLLPLYPKHGFVAPPQINEVYAPNPPLFVRLFSWLVRLPPRGAFAVWVAVEGFCLGFILWTTRRLLRGQLSAPGWWWVVALTLLSDVVLFHFGFSQLGLVLAALALQGFTWHRQGRPVAACVAVTLAGLLKVYPVVLLPWFVWRGAPRPRDWLRRLTAVAGTAAVVVLLTGPGLWWTYVTQAMPALTSVSLNAWKNNTLPALVINLGQAAQGFQPSPGAAAAWKLVGIAVGAALIGYAYWTCWRSGSGDPAAEFALLCIVLLAGQLTCWQHYLVFMVFPMAVAATRVRAWPAVSRATFLLWVYLLLNAFDPLRGPFWESHPVVRLMADRLPLAGLLIMMAFFVAQLRPARPAGATAQGGAP